MNPRKRMTDDLRGAGQLAIDGVVGVTGIVEAMHAAVAHLPSLVGRRAPATTRGVTGLVYRSVRSVARMAGAGVDTALSTLAPMLADGARSPRREAIVAALNGAFGDHLEATGNPLAIRMQLRHAGDALPLARSALRKRLPDATGKLLVMVHGLCMNDLQWRSTGHDHGEALARDLASTPVYLHYNTGRHVADNGRDFAAMLDRLVAAWPVPVEEIALVCHSMGGLVARSALDAAFAEQRRWSAVPLRIVFLGTPHHGAPLERAGRGADLLMGLSPYSAPFVRLGQARSAGIQDLRHGRVRDDDAPVPLPKQVRAYAIAATMQAARAGRGDTDVRGDGLVPVASAFGVHADRKRSLGIPASRRWLAHGVHHLQLLDSPAVYARIARWLR